MRGKEALVQAVVKNIARKEDKPPETRSDDELRALLRTKGEQTMQVSLVPVDLSYVFRCGSKRFEDARTAKNEQKHGPTSGPITKPKTKIDPNNDAEILKPTQT